MATFFRYLLVGGIAFLFDFSAYLLFTLLLTINYLLASVFSFLLGTLLNYLLSIQFVFEKRSICNSQAEFAVFLLIGVLGAAISATLIYTLTDMLAFPHIESKVFTSIAVVFFNYRARKILLFS